MGAEIKLSDIPYSKTLKKIDKDLAIDLALTGGDDYELCFTVPSHISQSNLKKMITTKKIILKTIIYIPNILSYRKKL